MKVMKRGCFIVENAKVLMCGLKFPGYFYYIYVHYYQEN